MPLKTFLAIQCIVSLFLLGCNGGPAADSPGSDTVEVSANTLNAPNSGSNSKEGGEPEKSGGQNDGSNETVSGDKKNADDMSLWRHENSLTVPPKAREQNDATEMVRAWVVDQQLVCSLRPEIWEDPGTWGVLLADVAYQIANANAELRGIPARKTLADIATTFNGEMPKPQAEAKPVDNKANETKPETAKTGETKNGDDKTDDSSDTSDSAVDTESETAKESATEKLSDAKEPQATEKQNDAKAASTEK